MTKESVLALLAQCRSQAPETIKADAFSIRSKADVALIRQHFSALSIAEQWNIRASVEEAVSAHQYRMERAIFLCRPFTQISMQREAWRRWRKLQDCLY